MNIKNNKYIELHNCTLSELLNAKCLLCENPCKQHKFSNIVYCPEFKAAAPVAHVSPSTVGGRAILKG